MKPNKFNSERDGLMYHQFAAEAASVERRLGDHGISVQRQAKLLTDAGECWLRAARKSHRVGITYAHHRFDFCRAALVRLGRADLVQQLDSL